MINFVVVRVWLIICCCLPYSSVFCVSSSGHFNLNGPVFDIRDFGAVGDGITLNTKSILSAIDAASKVAGPEVNSIVYIPGPEVEGNNNTFLSGPLTIPSYVTLYISSHSKLQASSNVMDYIHLSPSDWAFLLIDNNSSNVNIVGEDKYTSIIDGGWDTHNYVAGWDDEGNKFIPHTWEGINNCTGECRIRTILIRGTQYFTLKEVKVQNSPDWTIHFLGSQYIQIDSVEVYGSFLWPNNDGIDIDSCRHIVISNVNISTGDDGICLKTSQEEYGPLYNMTVNGAIIKSRSSAIKIGSATVVDIYEASFNNIFIYESNCGLGIQARDGGSVYNIKYTNITIDSTSQSPLTWWGSGEAIWISSMPRGKDQLNNAKIFNIFYQNIWARATQNTALISGRPPGLVVENVYLTNVEIIIDRLSNWNYSHPDLDYRPTTAIDPQTINLPTEVLHLEYVKGLSLNNVTMAFNEAHAQPYWNNERNCLNQKDANYPVEQTDVVCQKIHNTIIQSTTPDNDNIPEKF